MATRTRLPAALAVLLSISVIAACATGPGGTTAAAPNVSSTDLTSRAAALPAIDSARLIDDIHRLAHDSMGGRGSMSPENAKARAWLVSEFIRIGLEPVNGSHEHSFVMARRGRADSVRGANVLGVIRGRLTPDRVIVVSAHYDHVGTRGGEIFNGADDNASGTAAVLALAAHFRANRPGHTILFALWDAEEVGLLGARAFVSTPPIPLAAMVANVNLDMVSRNDRDELFAAGASRWPQMRPILEGLVPQAAVHLRLGHDSGGGQDDWTNQSDQGAFNEAGIPFVYFGVEDHPDYHKATDDPERIHPRFYVRAVRTIASFVERLDVAAADWKQ